MRTHDTEFDPSYQCPPLPTGFTDSSWHNEACPSYQMDLDKDIHVRIWMEHPTPSKREIETTHRFVVASLDESCEPVDLLETDDFEIAIACCWMLKAFYISTKNLTSSIDKVIKFKESLHV